MSAFTRTFLTETNERTRHASAAGTSSTTHSSVNVGTSSTTHFSSQRRDIYYNTPFSQHRDIDNDYMETVYFVVAAVLLLATTEARRTTYYRRRPFRKGNRPTCPPEPTCTNPSTPVCQHVAGCRVCTCATPPQCPTFPACPSECLFGTTFQKDVNGCDVCVCTPPFSCPPLPECASLTFCTFGFKRVDSCVSPTCECNPEACPPLTCSPQTCPLGFVTDVIGFGCPKCECRRPETAVACPPLPCLALLDCFAGSSLVRVNGCPVCRCGPAPVCSSPAPDCGNTQCQLGFKFVDGCRTCQCRSVCPTLQCDRTICPEGFATDASGCPTCSCNAGS